MTGPYSVPDDSSTPYPITFQRVQALMHSMGYQIDFLVEGRVAGAVFDKIPFLFSVDSAGRFLSVRAIWEVDTPAQELDGTYFTAADQWNRENYFPTIYSTTTENGRGHVCADFALDAEAGVSDDQLRDAISVGISTGIEAITYMKSTTGTNSAADR
ncbi:YbjN domain-containing protein [Schaalia sp. ZJ1691]|uniref:YbjN domain-containing protein n=1 Tax=Schaalia sp. ZJ1691 TaxID=2709404 RepID=UPI0013EA3342|nr:YbjN domain-containing protein [Schaalia sp. ZJ1691]